MEKLTDKEVLVLFAREHTGKSANYESSSYDNDVLRGVILYCNGLAIAFNGSAPPITVDSHFVWLVPALRRIRRLSNS